VYFRHNANDSVMVVLNKNHETVELKLNRFAERLQGFQEATDVVSGEVSPLSDMMTVPARSVKILELD
jgi:hypothetical protein